MRARSRALRALRRWRMRRACCASRRSMLARSRALRALWRWRMRRARRAVGRRSTPAWRPGEPGGALR
eukprot:13158214-Heterocapsa_arctica.AAC.1